MVVTEYKALPLVRKLGFGPHFTHTCVEDGGMMAIKAPGREKQLLRDLRDAYMYSYITDEAICPWCGKDFHPTA